METKNLNDYVAVYKELLNLGNVQIAYAELVKYVQKLRTAFSKELNNDYSVGNVLQGYMDYTYFYLSNDYLNGNKLKLGLVLNHAEANFEIWLLGHTKDVQEKYWTLLKNTEWIRSSNMPQHSVFEFTLIKNPDFESLDELTDKLKSKFTAVSNEILASLKKMA